MPMKPAKTTLPGETEADRLAAWREYCDMLYAEGAALGTNKSGSVTVHFQNGAPRKTQWNTIGEKPQWATG